MPLNAHDQILLDCLREADDALFRAWKKSIAGSSTMQDINRAQDIIHKLIGRFTDKAKAS